MACIFQLQYALPLFLISIASLLASSSNSCQLYFEAKQSLGLDKGVQLQFCCNVTSIEIWSLEYSNESQSLRLGQKTFERKLNLSSDIWTELENNSPSFQLSACSDRREPTIGWVAPHKNTTCKYYTGQTVQVTSVELALPRWYIICYRLASGCTTCKLSILCGNDFSAHCYGIYLSGSSSVATNQSLNYWIMQGSSFPFSSISTVDLTVRYGNKEVASEKDIKLAKGEKKTYTFSNLQPRHLYTIERCLRIALPSSILSNSALSFSSPAIHSICAQESYRTRANLSISRLAQCHYYILWVACLIISLIYM